MEIIYTPRFVKLYRRLPEKVRVLAEKKERIFRNDLYDKSLKTHKLSGTLEGEWAFSINHSYRIIFEMLGDDRVLFTLVGTHKIYQ
ncbi:MAG: type II toxin-antitoxin system mRNA interferase toxin, RelE/StbE family [bacterium]